MCYINVFRGVETMIKFLFIFIIYLFFDKVFIFFNEKFMILVSNKVYIC